MQGSAPSSAGVADNASNLQPRKRINSPQDVQTFTQSNICQQLMSFMGELCEAVKCKPVSHNGFDRASLPVQSLVGVLDELERWIEDFPPLEQPMRFGNKAFRQWQARLQERAEGTLFEMYKRLPSAEDKADSLALETSCYLSASFGDERRIDYGTGHEVAFFAMLFVLGAKNVVSRADAADLVLVVFVRYLKLVRKLQKTYVLEPAGSHGIWGLDDFHALPFMFGAAQLIGSEDEIPTGEVYKDKVVNYYYDQYLYVDAIRQVLQAKKGAPFSETSPMLFSITAVPSWQKTYTGLVKMYKAEVLGKFPVIQHFLFGPTIPWPGDKPEAA